MRPNPAVERTLRIKQRKAAHLERLGVTGMPPATFTVTKPAEASVRDLRDFTALVRAGAEVTLAGLEARIRAAFTLVLARQDRCVVGIAALKVPNSNYRATVFRKAAVAAVPCTFPLELGWVFVEPRSRGTGLSHSLVSRALAVAPTSAIFATSRSDNIAMHRSLIAGGFAQHVVAYASARGAHSLELFLRPSQLVAA